MLKEKNSSMFDGQLRQANENENSSGNSLISKSGRFDRTRLFRKMTDLEKGERLRHLKPGETGDLQLKITEARWPIANVPNRFDYSLGFNWGYRGTGPQALALAALFHYSGEDLAFAYRWYLDFTVDVVGHLPFMEDVIVPKEFIRDWISWAKSQNQIDDEPLGYQVTSLGREYVYSMTGEVMSISEFVE
jgi:hypothetical protein